MNPALPTLIVDTRETWPHVWAKHIGHRCDLRRGWERPDGKKPSCLPTGDFCLSDAFSFDSDSEEVEFKPARLVERKTLPDFYGVCTSNRERFSAELIRILDLRLQHGTHTQIIVEATWEQTLHYATVEHGMAESALRETVRAWERRFCPIVFAIDEVTAAWMTLKFLDGGMK